MEGALQVLAISLKVDRTVHHMGDSAITATLDVLTDQGVRRVHDVWFGMKLSRGNLATLMPGR